MTDQDYLKMLIVGIQQHPNYLKEYFQREQKQQAKNFISFQEFVDRTIKVIQALEQELNNQLYAEKARLLLSATGQEKEYIESCKEMVKELDLNNYRISILHLTTDVRQNFLQLNDINTLKKAVLDAFKDEIFNEDVTTNVAISKEKPGKKPAIIKPAQDYLQNIEFEERKILFIEELKKLYKGCEPKTFNHLIIVLLDIDILKEASKIELKISFEKALEPIEQSQQNFDKYLRSRKDGKDIELFNSLKRQISTIIKEKQVV